MTSGFFQRVHAPTLGATLGAWCPALATVAQGSFVYGQPFVHALLISVFIALTSATTTIFLLRAAIFRERLSGSEDVPANPCRKRFFEGFVDRGVSVSLVNPHVTSLHRPTQP